MTSFFLARAKSDQGGNMQVRHTVLPGSAVQFRRAVAIGVDCDALGERCDVVLDVEPPGTFRG